MTTAMLRFTKQNISVFCIFFFTMENLNFAYKSMWKNQIAKHRHIVYDGSHCYSIL